MKTGNARRVIVVTGASAGLGRAIARAFARSEGAHIGLIARGTAGLEAAKSDPSKVVDRWKPPFPFKCRFCLVAS
jgi:NAD(P)-dependent dehydrogenase (short-subunit alcohol dehydrogenase family)